jgi:hypothetical protein
VLNGLQRRGLCMCRSRIQAVKFNFGVYLHIPDYFLVCVVSYYSVIIVYYWTVLVLPSWLSGHLQGNTVKVKLAQHAYPVGHSIIWEVAEILHTEYNCVWMKCNELGPYVMYEESDNSSLVGIFLLWASSLVRRSSSIVLCNWVFQF